MLIPKTKEKILKCFFFNPQIPLYVREVARRSRISTQNAHKYLKSLKDIGFLKRTEEHNQVFYKPNLDNPFLIKFFELFEIERREAVLSKKNKLKSKAERMNKERSPFQEFAWLMGNKTIVVTPNRKDEGITREEFMKKIKDPNFYNDLMKQRIVIFGEGRFWECIK